MLLLYAVVVVFEIVVVVVVDDAGVFLVIYIKVINFVFFTGWCLKFQC